MVTDVSFPDRHLRPGTDTAQLLIQWRGTPTVSLDLLRAALAEVLDDAL